SKLPSIHVVIIRPSSCHSSRKRSHLRASRNNAQFSTISRIANLPASSLALAIAFPPVNCIVALHYDRTRRRHPQARDVGSWHISDLTRCPLFCRCWGTSGHQTRLVRASHL